MDTLISDRKVSASWYHLVDGVDSSWSQVTSDIPQGSDLGPLIFLLFINDTPDDIMISVKIFADDTKVFKDVQSEDEMLILRKDVGSLCDWYFKWQLQLDCCRLNGRGIIAYML